MKSPDFSVVILCYKSGNFAKTFYKKVIDVLKKDGLDYEIILVGNYVAGKGDITPDVVRELERTNDKTKALTIEKKDTQTQGMSWDLRSGLEAATGKTIAFIDGDGQMPPEDLPRLYHELVEKKLDLCKAKRITRGDGPYRKFISGIFNNLMKILFPGIVANDINAKPKVFTREAFEKLHLESNTWFADGEIMIKARRYGFTVGEVETIFLENPERKSFISLKANFEFLKNIFYWRLKEFGFFQDKNL